MSKKFIFIYITPFLLLLLFIIIYANGVIYTLDDPYIHMALARNIGSGHYGINITEYSAPSSSVVWPFLLAPFSFLPSALFNLTPLIINGSALWATISVLRITTEGRGNDWRSLWLTLGLLLSCNAYGLVFTGMEHSLQLLLVTVIVTRLANRREDLTFWVCLVAIPFVRYEGLAISLPVFAHLLWFKKISPTHSHENIGIRKIYPLLLSFLIMAGGLVAFSFFLHDLELGWMPSSIVAKMDNSIQWEQGSSLLSSIAHTLTNSSPKRAIMCVVVLGNGWLMWRLWRRADLLFIVMFPGLLHIFFGKYGWFGRYEAYMMLYQFLWPIAIGCELLISSQRAVYISLFIAAATMSSLWINTIKTPLACLNIKQQQLQMGLIAKHLKEPVAVNDLGEVAMLSQHYVLDLWGLGSMEALRARRSGSPDAQWIEQLMIRHNVEFAFIYDKWFPLRPSGWQRIATLNLPKRWVMQVGDTQVSLYATNGAAAERLTRALITYQATEPGAAEAGLVLHSDALHSPS